MTKMETNLHVGPGVATPDALLVKVGVEWVEMPSTLTPLGEALRRLCDDELALIAERRRTRAAVQEHVSEWDEMATIAAEVYAATSDDPDPHGDLSWREMFADDLPY
jgi:hypothetical protein